MKQYKCDNRMCNNTAECEDHKEMPIDCICGHGIMKIVLPQQYQCCNLDCVEKHIYNYGGEGYAIPPGICPACGSDVLKLDPVECPCDIKFNPDKPFETFKWKPGIHDLATNTFIPKYTNGPAAEESPPVDLKKLVNDHWSYIEKLLQTHNTHDDEIRTIEFHYKTAFEHGYKHAKEDM